MPHLPDKIVNPFAVFVRWVLFICALLFALSGIGGDNGAALVLAVLLFIGGCTVKTTKSFKRGGAIYK